MQNKAFFKKVFVDIVRFLYILLFVYASVSKLLEFDHFRIQLGKSPLLSVFAEVLVWAVPVGELLIVALLCLPKLRVAGLWASFFVMLLFTAYIAIMLNFSSYVPCSCGGILEDLDWTEHLVFNIAVSVLGLSALVMLRQDATSSKLFWAQAVSCLLVSFATVAALYGISEHEIHRNNAFIRRYPQHPVEQLNGYDLEFDSFYIAGFDEGNVYLGNVTAPRNLKRLDTALAKAVDFRIKLEGPSDYAFSSVQVKLLPPFFFLGDGTVPIIYKGSIADWRAKTFLQPSVFFSQWQPIDGNTFLVRTLDRTHANVLGSLSRQDGFGEAKGLIQKQSDGAFDTDGLLGYNRELRKLAYVYYYRNRFVTASPDFNGKYEGKTVDTVSKAQLKFAYEQQDKVRTLARPPLQVNKHSCTSGRYLFVMSDRLGRYEPGEMLKDARIVDVYDLVKRTYEFSFYLYDYKKEKVTGFEVNGHLLYGLTEHYLVRYRLKAANFDFTVADKTTP
ncbi:hypothetical protein HUK80_13465 [Flavobacterium sp. MAH-1]|uniref:Methylamine utilisation protein MauE domain-containing protein n=1 Tax=Flavobacterium agri TaxID=2743471 RepID=A0A7Y8Y3P4_9FLAO|nr:MauE/DoxX family redox-associated membrane protein [Flavobacterium agri]NUY81907.1 hypothetical protein [Flavobacterium agri]NYA71931.1 hypothetical protein [Flavobacterium agri]